MIALVLALGLGANPYLEQAREDYVALDFEKCVQRLGKAAESKSNTPDEQRDIELYAGLCQLNLSHRREAAEHFKLALRIDQDAELPPYSSPKAVELFLRVKKTLQTPPPTVADADSPFDTELLPKPKPTPPPLPPPPPPSFRKHGGTIALGLVGVAALAAGIGLGLHAKALESQANNARYDSDFVSLGNAARDNAVAANVAYGVSVVAGTAGLVIFFTND